jgi:hypothetical protein
MARFVCASTLTIMHIMSSAGDMFVVKRDGRHETVQFDKITARIKKLVSAVGIPELDHRQTEQDHTECDAPCRCTG